MSGRNRGAAQVSVMWVIALSVILVFVVLFAILSQQKVSQAEQAAQAAREAAQQAVETRAARDEALHSLSQAVGFVEGSSGDSSLDAFKAQLEDTRQAFPSAAAAESVEALLPAMISDYNKLLKENRDLSAQVATLRNDLSARQAAHASAMQEKDKALADLRREFEDTRQSLQNQITDLERQRDGLRDQVREQDRQLAEQRTRMDALQRSFAADQQVAKQRRDILSERLDQVTRRADQPDGTILSASAKLGKAWIDRGRRDRVQVGMEFEVLNPLDKKPKGRIKVINVEDRRAECEILSVKDRFQPIDSDDLVTNEIFDPTRHPVAVLLGNGFGRFSAEDMKLKLAQIGIVVSPKVDRETDYLILGTPFFDEETGDMIPWDSNAVYQDAESLSVQVVPLRDAFGWLGL